MNYLNNLELRYKGGSGGEEITIIEVLKLLINCVKFVYGHRDILGWSHIKLYNSSLLLRVVKDCISVKVNKERANPLTKVKVLEDLKKVEECKRVFPSSYYHLNLLGNKYAKDIFSEIDIMRKIIGEHFNDVIK